jgi:transcriptional regulator with XRE-family HTH domain
LQLSELKLISASNIIKLRTGAGMTQAELGEKLNYSDKTISKWERGEAIPDAYVLTQLAEIFGVTVDYILSSHSEWKPSEVKPEEKTEEHKYSINMIIAISVLGVWTLALTIFVLVWMFGNAIVWEIFVTALPISILVYMILICAFNRRKNLQYVIAAFVMSVFVFLYCVIPMQKPWQLFLIAIPAEIIVFLSCNIRIKSKKTQENDNK